MNDNRIALRINRADQANLLTIARALHAGRSTDPSPWAPAVNVTLCLRTALKVAAEAARNGTLTAHSEAH